MKGRLFFYDPLFDKKYIYNTLGWNKGDFSADGRFAYFDPVANFFATSSSSKHLLEIYVSHFLVSSSSAYFLYISFFVVTINVLKDIND